MAPDGSKSIVGPLFADKRTAKPDIKKHRGDLPRTPRRRPGNGRAGGIAALLAAGLAAVFLLVRYVDWHDASSPAHVPLSAGNIQRESDAEPLIQAELAALMDTVLDRTDSPPGLTQSTQDRPTSESVHIIPGVPDTSEQSESDTEIARMDSASEPEPVLQPLAPEADTIHREDWLLDQPRGNYMLQLRWDRDQVTLKRFTEQYRLPGPSAYYKEQWNDKDRYVLVYGNYPTRHAALADLETLPEPVRNNGPWPRKMTSIQTLIRQQEDAPLR